MKLYFLIPLLIILSVANCAAQTTTILSKKAEIERFLKINREVISRYAGKRISDLPSRDREYLLTAKAREVILLHGPGYYRDFKAPEIQLTQITESMLPRDLGNREYLGKMLYIVTFDYDKTKEQQIQNFTAQVSILEESGEILEVVFGNGIRRIFYRDPSQYRTLQGVVQYQQIIGGKVR
ncbi:hypothetical protein MTO98_25445 [Mucilaginibacter sp. SMC90]|uniref:hypothetical protein n=1 Tax=Mucilaginibacter sp. SMC90 TaxID=2929803 RepID=UPI001FB46C3B|nr:hypothetical protein [Mucilaginibacter sp. SMC90]UOE47760.1 hypothetical protein MTO98_25445 [Mucilaginibacter sp. SMC90]